jgi:hypothetical protein
MIYCLPSEHLTKSKVLSVPESVPTAKDEITKEKRNTPTNKTLFIFALFVLANYQVIIVLHPNPPPVQWQNVQPLQKIIINRPETSSGFLASACTIVLIVLENFFFHL